MKSKTIGVLALQGCVSPHQMHIEALGCQFLEVRSKEDFQEVDGLILPGGESTTMLKLLHVLQLEETLLGTCNRVPVWGICAGAILIAKKVLGPEQKSFALIDASVERNAFGRQLESFHDTVAGYAVSFIRAPKVLSVGDGVKVLAEKEGSPTWIQSGFRMLTTFHPELNSQAPSPMHRFFLEMILKKSRGEI
ncbi:MAG: pyridoxal 5'-phosphate synthase glutaminase subunit PdxT [Oligoflexales bacterium]|nr:pyridoxal 5'-phosphate synthase glutaminase subunit PdxT [Oligoflexales bacterium]